MNAFCGRGACLLRMGCASDAVDEFRQALTLYPNHAQLHFGLTLALGAAGAHEAAAAAMLDVREAAAALSAHRPIEAALVRSHLLTAEGRAAEASAILCTMLDAAPPGFAAWTLPIEPLLNLPGVTEALAPAFARLSKRAS
jgi:hypothetical protein